MDDLVREALDDDATTPQPGPRERSMTVDLMAPDEAAVKITITNFLAKDNLLFYAVETNTTLEHFTKHHMIVNRKLEDFIWLHERLSENADLAGNIIPHLPVSITRESEKQTAIALQQNGEGVARIKEDAKNRCAQMERFLKRIAQIPKLRTDSNLQAFLEYDELQPRKSQGWFNFSASVNPKIDTDEAFEKMRAANAQYQKGVSSSLIVYNRLVKCDRTVGDVFGSFPPALNDVRGVDSNPEWQKMIDVYSKGCATAKETINNHANSVDSILGDILTDYTGLCGAVTAMHNRRLTLLQRSIDAKLQRIKSEGKAQKNPKLQDEVKLMSNLETEAQQAFSNASGLASVEVVRTRAARAVDYRNALTALATAEVESANQEISNWQAILEELRA